MREYSQACSHTLQNEPICLKYQTLQICFQFLFLFVPEMSDVLLKILTTSSSYHYQYEDISDKESLWQEQLRKLHETPLSHIEVLDDIALHRLDETYGGVTVASNGEHLLERCHPCFLCSSCSKQWGGSLPERYFPNARKEFFRSACQESPPILDSEKTIAAKKRKRGQGRHGPKSKTSPYRGVNHYTRTNRWEAHIWLVEF